MPIATIALDAPRRRASRRDATNTFYLGIMALLWASNITGFGLTSYLHFARGAAPYPMVSHLHAAAFVGWMVLFTIQLILVRAGRLDRHRALGQAMAGLALFMLAISPFAAVAADRVRVAENPQFPAGFILLQFGDLALFGGLVAAALLMRRRAAAHKRLMMLAMINLSTAGFGRWVFPLMVPLTGTGPIGSHIAGNLPVLLVIAAMAVFDQRVFARQERAFVIALPVIIAMQLFQTWATSSAAGTALGRAILGV